mmetsp:Transcript_38776/g.82377  ORF Transcript_38776/g.82377 Transcript_38776/m.82377 type:complete len:218 (+) Transcript_38776:2261-2914(+)
MWALQHLLAGAAGGQEAFFVLAFKSQLTVYQIFRSSIKLAVLAGADVDRAVSSVGRLKWLSFSRNPAADALRSHKAVFVGARQTCHAPLQLRRMTPDLARLPFAGEVVWMLAGTLRLQEAVRIAADEVVLAIDQFFRVSDHGARFALACERRTSGRAAAGALADALPGEVAGVVAADQAGLAERQVRGIVAEQATLLPLAGPGVAAWGGPFASALWS